MKEVIEEGRKQEIDANLSKIGEEPPPYYQMKRMAQIHHP